MMMTMRRGKRLEDAARGEEGKLGVDREDLLGEQS